MSAPDIQKLRGWAKAGRYALAVLSVGFALLLTVLFHSDGLVAPLFFLAIILTAWFGGMGPGLVAALLSTLCIAYFFLPPAYSFKFDLSHLPQLLVFFISAALVSSWGAVRRRAETLLRRARDEQEAKVQERTADLKHTNEQLQSEISERRRVEETLRQRADLLDLTHDTVFVRDMKDVITYWNRGAEELYGWASEEAMGQVSHRLTQTIFPAPLEEINAELIRTGRWEGELVHARRDGARIVVTSRWALQRDERDRPVAVLETNNDITERKRAEESLRRNEYYLAEAQRLSHAGSWAVDYARQKTLYWSEEMFRICGFDLGRSLPDREESFGLMHPEDRDRVSEIVERAYRDKSDFATECRIVVPDGTLKHLHMIGHALLDETGEVVEYAGTTMDVTERKRAEEELRERANLLDLTHDTVFVRDMNDVITYWNRGAEELYGWKKEEAIGGVSHELMHTVFPAPLEGINETLLATGRWEGELIHTKRDGATVVVASRWSLQRDEHGSPIAMLETNNDVTQRKRAEEELQKTQAELAHTARVTTMGELTSSIAHEVNQPLTAIVTNGNACLRWLAIDPPNVEEARQTVARVVKDGHRASEVVGRIRAFFRKAAPQKTTVEMNQLIKEVIAMVPAELRRNRVRVRTALADDLPRIVSDQIQLQQVLLNLVINAIEAMSTVNRPRQLLIESCRDEAGGVLVRVQDNGIGFDKEDAAQLFNAFYTTKRQGLGMGLSISRTTIEAYGGRLWATANDGEGSTFQFTLPISHEGVVNPQSDDTYTKV